MLFFVAGQNLVCFKSDLLIPLRVVLAQAAQGTLLRGHQGAPSVEDGTILDSPAEEIAAASKSDGGWGAILASVASILSNGGGGLTAADSSAAVGSTCRPCEPLLPHHQINTADSSSPFDARYLNLVTALFISGLWLLWNAISLVTCFWTLGWNRKELLTGRFADDLDAFPGGKAVTAGSSSLSSSRNVPDIADAFKNNSLDLLVTDDVYHAVDDEGGEGALDRSHSSDFLLPFSRFQAENSSGERLRRVHSALESD